MSKLVIGICGGSASGKTSICSDIIYRLSHHRVNIISQDNFYKPLDPSINTDTYNFDHPDAIDFEAFYNAIDNLKKGLSMEIPIYDFKTHNRLPDKVHIIPESDVILVEGILIFNDIACRNLYDIKIFIETDSDLALMRRIIRDTNERDRTLESIIDQYTMFVKPSYEQWVLPTKKYANIIIPNAEYNHVAIDIILHHINRLL
jgi:uridine kinase